MLAKKLMAWCVSLCMTVGLFTGIELTAETEDVKAESGGFTQYDFLKTDGTYIKNNSGKGNNVYLRGTNLGNLFVQESWMSSTDAEDQKEILETLTGRFGQDKALELLDYYESNYFTEADFDRCQNLGMSVLRVPFTYMNLYKKSGNDWVLRENAFQRLDWIVEQAGKRGIYVILDLHGAFGSQNGQDHSGEVINSASDVTFFSNESLMSKTLELWRNVAQHYAGNPTVAGYDTLNEPGEKAGTTGEKHWKFYDRMYDTIRSVDADHIIIMESCWGVSNLPNPKTYGWENVMYEYHHYPWDYVADTDANYNGQVNAIDNLVNSVNNANYGVPTYIGEFNCFDGAKSWEYVLDKMNNAGWHYTNWSYKARGMGSWGIYHETGNEKVKPSTSSETDIRRIWGSSSIGTNVDDRGVTYNHMRTKLPGTVVFADKEYTNDDYYTLQAAINSKYVVADHYGEANLVADRDSAGEWEQFRIIPNSDGTVSFQSRANNKYLCAVFDDTDTENPIIARSSKISDWEKFYLEKQENGTYAIRTYTNNYYVQADVNDATAGILHACGTSVGTWEPFYITSVSGKPGFPSDKDNEDEQTTQQPTAPQTTEPAKGRVVGYLPSYKTYAVNQIDFSGLTHCVLSFMTYANGTLTSGFSAGDVQNIVGKCHQNGVKALIAIGGGGGFDTGDNPLGTAQKRTAIVDQIMNYVAQYDLDGVDIDTEVTDGNFWNNFEAFISELSGRLKAQGKLLTMAVSSWFTDAVLNSTYKYFDFVNLMTYDENAGNGPVASMNFVNNQISYYKNKGIEDDRLVIGVPFYGYGPGGYSDAYSYGDIINADANNRFQDTTIINGKTVYYNGENTIREKAQLSKSYGGIMIWELSQDSFGEHSLLSVIRDTLSAQDVPQQPTVTEIPGTVPVESYASKSDEITIHEGTTTYAGDLNNGSVLEYDIHVKEAGTYTFTFRFAAGDAQYNAKNMIIKIDGRTAVSIPVQATSGWEVFAEYSEDLTFAQEGQYKISITADSGACNVADFSAVRKKEETTTEKPAESTTPKPIESTTPKPAESTTPKPVETTTEKPAESTTPKPIESTTPKPVESTTLKPVETTTVENVTSDLKAPEGLTYAGNDNLPYYFAWAPVPEAEGYNVYLNGKYITTVNISAVNFSEELFAVEGIYTVSVQSVKGDKVSALTTITYNTLTGEVGIPQEPVTVESTTEKPTESTTPKPVETTTEKPAESITPKPVETTTEKPSESVTPKPVETTTEKPSESVTPKPVETTTEKPSESITPKPVETKTEKPSESVTPKPVETTTEKPAESITPKPVETKTEKPSESITPKPMETTTEKPIESTTSKVQEPTTPKRQEITTVKPHNSDSTAEMTSMEKAPETGAAEKAEQEILNAGNDKDFKGSVFGKLRARVRRTTKKSNKITWRKVRKATSYRVYGAKCGTKVKKLTQTNALSFTHKKLKKGTYYKYLVMAVDSSGNVLSVSKMIHSATRGGKAGNAKKLKVNSSRVLLKKGHRFRLKAKAVTEIRKTKIKRHRPIYFESSDSRVVRVTKKGMLQAVKKGKCKIYVYAQNGVYRVVKVVVE